MRPHRLGMSKSKGNLVNSWLLDTTASMPTNMRLLTISLGLLAYMVSLVSATALTYKLAAHEKACFYSNVSQKGAKIAFYFAVSAPSATLHHSVPSGRFKADEFGDDRSNQVVNSMLTTRSPVQGRRSSWMEQKRGRETLSLQRLMKATTSSASIIRWAPSQRSLSTSKLRYEAFFVCHCHTHLLGLTTLTLTWSFRLKTKLAPSCPQSKAPIQNRHPLWRSPSLSFRQSSRPSHEIKSISGHARIETLAPWEVRKGAFSTSPSSKVWWWYAWLDYRFLSSVSSSR